MKTQSQNKKDKNDKMAELKQIRLGTRGSPLALTQTGIVKAEIEKIAPGIKVEIVPIRTSGDWLPSDGETRLSTAEGGKGQFAKEIEAALLSGRIDAAVHSAKDMETTLPDGLSMGAYLPREDARDSLIINKLANNSQKIFSLESGITVGTASVRRQAFLLHKRPDLKVVPFRGNVQTRLEKLQAGQVDATLLAIAGLNRLGLSKHAGHILPIEDFLPAAAQGAVGIEFPMDRPEIIAIFSQINHTETQQRVECERAVVRVLDGSCHTPIGAHATLQENVMTIRTCVASLDGKQYFEQTAEGKISSLEDAITLGQKTGETLKAKLPEGILSQHAG